MSACVVPRSPGLMHPVTRKHLLHCTTNMEILSCHQRENNFKLYSNSRNQISMKQFYSFSSVIFQSLAISKFTNNVTLSFFIQANFACALSVLGEPGMTHLPCSAPQADWHFSPLCLPAWPRVHLRQMCAGSVQSLVGLDWSTAFGPHLLCSQAVP